MLINLVMLCIGISNKINIHITTFKTMHVVVADAVAADVVAVVVVVVAVVVVAADVAAVA
jgi:hypothetical protein